MFKATYLLRVFELIKKFRHITLTPPPLPPPPQKKKKIVRQLPSCLTEKLMVLILSALNIVKY